MSANDVLTLVIAAVASGVALATFLRALAEYRQQGRQRRAAQFFEIGRRLEEKQPYEEICGLLEQELAGQPAATEALEAMSFRDKFVFLGLFEELALLMRSRLVKPEVAHYMYGYYAIQCLRSKGFWRGALPPDEQSVYWLLFKEFAEEMLEIERHDMPNIDKLRF